METIGGQALIEGVLMRSKKKLAIAIRKDKKIIIKKEDINFPQTKIPFLRGILTLIESLYLGFKALNYSSSVALSDEKEKSSGFLIIISTLFAIALALLIFKFTPLFIVQKIDDILNLNYILFNTIEGIIKIIFLIVYIYLISLMSDVRRVFQYHGAEHKAVNCYESGEKLTVKNCKKYSTIHERCGTSFLLFVFFISVLFYILIPKNFSFSLKLILRILLLPFIAAVSYEFLKLSYKLKKNKIMRLVSLPGLFVQKLTTKEPDDKQLEVAIKALNTLKE